MGVTSIDGGVSLGCIGKKNFSYLFLSLSFSIRTMFVREWKREREKEIRILEFLASLGKMQKFTFDRVPVKIPATEEKKQEKK